MSKKLKVYFVPLIFNSRTYQLNCTNMTKTYILLFLEEPKYMILSLEHIGHTIISPNMTVKNRLVKICMVVSCMIKLELAINHKRCATIMGLSRHDDHHRQIYI